MDFYSLIFNAVLLICFGSAFVYGLHKCTTSRKILYFQMITAAVGCAAVTRLFNCVELLCDGRFNENFNIGLIGPVSGFMLIFCANFGAIDTLVDDRSRSNRKYRITALIAPLCLAALSVFIVTAEQTTVNYRVTTAISLVSVLLASYFNLKHLIFPDDGMNMILSLRKYNLLALLLELLYVCELIFYVYESKTMIAVVYILTAVTAAVIMPVLSKGVGKWTI